VRWGPSGPHHPRRFLPEVIRRRRSSSLRCSVVAGEPELLERLRAGDEPAFAELVDRYHSSPRSETISWTCSGVTSGTVESGLGEAAPGRV